MSATLLLIQNPDSANTELVRHFESLHYYLRHTEDVASAIKLIDDHGLKPSAILVDIPNIDETQMSLLESIGESLGIHEWVFLTYDLASPLADRLEKLSYRRLKQPCSVMHVEMAIKKAMRSTIVRRRMAELASNNATKNSFASIVGKSDVITEHRRILKELSQVPISTLMILGETGTGKGHAARLLHRNGIRKEYPFVEMNCAAMPSELVESQLFGHEAGAFTGAKGRHRGLLEQADNGTLFLDEIGEMPIEVQSKLLKAIEEQVFRRVGGKFEIRVDVQIFAASNRDMQKMVVDGKLREDLYHRLNVFEIEVPPLRAYKTDLLDLVPIIVTEFNLKSGKKVQIIPDDAWSMMMEYDWPGNVRELRNAIERAVLLSKNDRLNASRLNLKNTLLEDRLDDVDDAEDVIEGQELLSEDVPIDAVQTNQVSFTLDGKLTLNEMDRQIIERALHITQQNISRAAELLGVTRETIRYRVQKYELDLERDSTQTPYPLI
ncbi:MAG: sigma-54-dependent Fis family transcriptional regulator [Gammaproteobacteria bacterium]|nr:sigma-54-dependent Fis family transcriptional regulator [Gammaproteobacteria bacterium]